MVTPKRQAFLDAAKRIEGKPYVYGTDGPDTFDCSGVVAYCLLHAAGLDWRKTWWADRMREKLPPTVTPAPGDLALYPGHVMLVWGDGRVFGACGGDSTTTSIERALKRAARVRFRRTVDYRPDFLGYRSLSEYLDMETP